MVMDFTERELKVIELALVYAPFFWIERGGSCVPRDEAVAEVLRKVDEALYGREGCYDGC